jgi:hypothetical protein
VKKKTSKHLSKRHKRDTEPLDSPNVEYVEDSRDDVDGIDEENLMEDMSLRDADFGSDGGSLYHFRTAPADGLKDYMPKEAIQPPQKKATTG